MQAFLTLTRRELATFLVSLTGYVIIAAAVFLMGLSFSILLTKLEESSPLPVTELFYMTPFFWLILLLTAPVIAMRLFAAEKYSGTFETLMTTPVGDLQVVIAKFTAAVIFHMLMWAPLLGCILVLNRYSHDAAALDWGAIGSTYIGILLLGCLFMSFGCFASALTKSQIVAAMVSLVIGISFFLIGMWGERFAPVSDVANDVLNYVSVIEHMQDFSRGVVDTRHVVFYLTSTLFFLFLTYRVVESRRWK